MHVSFSFLRKKTGEFPVCRICCKRFFSFLRWARFGTPEVIEVSHLRAWGRWTQSTKNNKALYCLVGTLLLSLVRKRHFTHSPTRNSFPGKYIKIYDARRIENQRNAESSVSGYKEELTICGVSGRSDAKFLPLSNLPRFHGFSCDNLRRSQNFSGQYTRFFNTHAQSLCDHYTYIGVIFSFNLIVRARAKPRWRRRRRSHGGFCSTFYFRMQNERAVFSGCKPNVYIYTNEHINILSLLGLGLLFSYWRVVAMLDILLTLKKWYRFPAKIN